MQHYDSCDPMSMKQKGVNVTLNNYENKVLGGLFGKNIGGTLGAPYEGNTSVLHLHYYDPVPTESLPNDDFELQLVWLDMLKRKGVYIKPSDFVEHWQNHTAYYISEYFMGQRNMGLGLQPPVCGSFNNPWTIGMGSTIRSEIWAMIAPGMPDIAAAYAYMDASCDHTGEGVYGEMFIAAIESAAFVEDDPNKLIDVGLSYIPAECGIREVVEFVRNERQKGTSPYVLRNLICAYYSHVCDFTYVLANVGFAVLGFLYGESFGESLCNAVNCGYDTDCSGATLGALLGIRIGRDAIPEEWTAPIGSRVVVSELVPGIEFAPTVEGVTDEICALGQQIISDPETIRKHLYNWTGLSFLDTNNPIVVKMPSSQEIVLISDEKSRIVVDYVDGPFIGYGLEKELKLKIMGTGNEPLEIDLEMAVPNGWKASINNSGSSIYKLNLTRGETVCLPVKITAGENGSIGLRNNLSLAVSGISYEISLAGMKCWTVTGEIDTRNETAIAAVEFSGHLDIVSLDVVRKQLALDDLTGLTPHAGFVRYLQTDLYSPKESNIEIIANSIAPIKAFLNGQIIINKGHRSPGILPTWHLQNIDIHLLPRDMGFAKVTFHKGWNTVMLRLEGTNYPQDINFHLVRILSDRIEDAKWGDYRPEYEVTNTAWRSI